MIHEAEIAPPAGFVYFRFFVVVGSGKLWDRCRVASDDRATTMIGARAQILLPAAPTRDMGACNNIPSAGMGMATRARAQHWDSGLKPTHYIGGTANPIKFIRGGGGREVHLPQPFLVVCEVSSTGT